MKFPDELNIKLREKGFDENVIAYMCDLLSFRQKTLIHKSEAIVAYSRAINDSNLAQIISVADSLLWYKSVYPKHIEDFKTSASFICSDAYSRAYVLTGNKVKTFLLLTRVHDSVAKVSHEALKSYNGLSLQENVKRYLIP